MEGGELEAFQEGSSTLRNIALFSLIKEVVAREPHACLEDNTTWHLVEDMESIRKELKIEKWLVFGGLKNLFLPCLCTESSDVVSELILRGIFMLRQKELQWFYQYGASEIYPEAWKGFIEEITEDKRSNLIEAYRV